MSKKILGIIGLRSGSKGLKNKNIKILGGIPLFAHVLQSAKRSKYINRIIVSTNSKYYQRLAKKWGAEAPFLRSAKLASDSSQELDFIKDLLKKLQKIENYKPDIIVRLLATCPFQKTKDIDNIIKKTISNDYDSAVIISPSKQHPEKALRIIGYKKKYLTSYMSKNPILVGSCPNRQKFPKAYFRSNVIVCKAHVIKKYNSLTSKKNGYIIIPPTIDIDDINDFRYAEFWLDKLNKH